MNLRSGEPYFVVRDGPVMSYAPLAADAACEVLVIGAGITGALTAHRLVKAGMSVVVVDKRNAARGSTAASTAIMQYEVDTPLAELGRLIGAADAARAYRLCAGAIEELAGLVAEVEGAVGVDCELSRVGSLYLASSAADEEGFGEEVRLRRACGIEAEVVSAAEVTARFGIGGGGRRSGWARGAIYSTSAATVNAYRLTHALLHRCVGMGARVHGGTRIESLEPGREGFEARTENGPVVRARRVVVCTGYEAALMLREPIVELRSTYAVATGVVRGPARSETFPPRCVVWESARPYLYVRATEDGRVIVGGQDEKVVEETARDALLPSKAVRLMERVRELYPGCDGAADVAWAGTFGETRDGLAYIGESPEHPGVLFNLGFGGNGMTFALIGAGLVSEVLRGNTPSDLELFRFGR